MNLLTLDYAVEVVSSTSELSYDEQQERERLEKLVERAFYEAGRALKQIRDRRLYRDSHETFEEYCCQRFAFTRRHVDYLVAGSQVVDNLMRTDCSQTDISETRTNGSQTDTLETRTNGSQILPTSERQVRALAKLEPREQRECWRQAVKAAGDKVPSGRQVKDIVDRIRERTKVPNPYREGDICILIPKDNPELRGKSGCWGAITHVGEYSCTIETWEAEYIVKIEHLLSLELSDDNRVFMRELLGRMRRLYQLPECDGAVNSLLTYFGKQSQPYLTPIQEELFKTIERNYGIGEPEQ